MTERLSIAVIRLIMLIGLVLLSTQADAASSGLWRCDGKFGLCRYLDSSTEQEIIPPRFEQGLPFSEGLAAVSIGGRYGYIDERGEIIIAPQFDSGGQFKHGLAEVVVGNAIGVINRKGEMVIPPMFQRAIPLASDVVLAVEGASDWRYGIANEGLPSLLFSSSRLSNAGLYHVAGYWVRKPELKRVAEFDSDGQGMIWATGPDGYLFGLLGSNGEWVISPQYLRVQPLKDGRAIVEKHVRDVDLSGAIDRFGRIAVPFESWKLSYWSNGWGIATDWEGKRALLDRSGKIIGGRYFDKVERAESGDVAKVFLDGRWQGLDRSGDIVANPDNGRVIASCPNGVRVVSIDGNVQVTDATGLPSTPYLYEPLLSVPSCTEPFAVKLNGRWGFVGVDGRLLADRPSFQNVYGFRDGYAAVSDGRKWGVIDASGRFVLPLAFDKYVGRQDNVFHLSIGERDIWLTEKGEERAKPETPDRRADGLSCGYGVKLIERDGLWGIAEADGAELVAPHYRAIECFKNGMTWVPIDVEHKWCSLGVNGEIRERPACRITHYPYLASHARPEMLDSDPFESSVQWSRALLDFYMGRREERPAWIGDGIRAFGKLR